MLSRKEGWKIRSVFYILLVLLVAGCSSTFNATLIPRGGGAQATGTVEGVNAKTMEVTLAGATYSGKVVQALSTGGGYANRYSSTLIGPAGVLRCEFSTARGSGNGVCTDSQSQIYDLLLQKQ